MIGFTTTGYYYYLLTLYFIYYYCVTDYLSFLSVSEKRQGVVCHL